ncbi:MAG TPA: ATP-binding protein [Gemmatimonadales bacterium]|nr:ATP-binding protein [Gemmatimonadales bacterium]
MPLIGGRERPREPRRPNRGPAPRALGLLRWVYVGRAVVPVVVFMAAAFSFRAQPPEVIVTLAFVAVVSVLAAGLSAWYTHVQHARPGATFLYSQALFDLGLATVIVHFTGGAESNFSALYILVIAVSGVLMPVASGLLVTLLGGLLYVADIVWGYPEQLSVTVGLQILVFVGVALATGYLASRVGVVGAEREVLQREVTRLRLEAGDILRNIGSGVVTVDGDGNLAYANPAAQALLGTEMTALVGRPIVEFLKARSPELWAAIVSTQRRGERTVRAEGRIVNNGQAFPIGLTTTALQVEPGSPPSVTAIFSDISDQKRLEELHLRTERLEAVAELSASLAHEIRNPLASIRSCVEQLSRSKRATADEQVLAGLVVRESERLSRLLNEFLDFSRVRATRHEPLDLLQVARAAVDTVREHPDCLPGAQVEVVGEPAPLEGDADLLHRVILNLVLNSVQAAGSRARVVVAVRPARAQDVPTGVHIEDSVLVSVSDNGPGIAPEIRERIFQPFVTGRAGGSGLGLAIVHRAVQAHRGVVLADKSDDRGTTFTVLLPKGAKPLTAPTAGQPAKAGGP